MKVTDSKRQKTAAGGNKKANTRLVVFAFASVKIDGTTYIPDQLYPRKPVNLQQSMPYLLTVCKAWNRAIGGIVDEFNAVTHTIRFQTGLPDELPGVLQALEGKGGDVRDLRVWFGTSRWSRYHVPDDVERTFENVEQLEIDWHRVLANCPHLVRLDLSKVPLNSKQLYKILDAASTHCHSLQSLIFLEYQTSYDCGPTLLDLPGVMSRLYQALRRWHQYQGSSGGLRQISVPNSQRPDDERDDEGVHPDEFWNQIATYCPNIEYLQGWKEIILNSLCPDDDSTMTLLCTLDSWHSFCKSCAQLREFYWFMVPLDDALLDIFAEYPKLNMKKMVFACGSYFDDEETFVSQQFHRRGGLKVTSNGIVKTIEACPALEEIAFWFAKEGCNSYMLQNETDDNVLRAVAANCLGLKKLTISKNPGEGDPVSIDITDAAFIAISRLPRLEHIAIQQAKVTAKGILALIQNSPNLQHKRRVIIELGCAEDYENTCVFEKLAKFIELLLSLPANSLQGHRFELELQLRDSYRDDSPKVMRARLTTLKDQVLSRQQNMKIQFARYHSVRGDDAPPKDLDSLESVFFISLAETARC